eukprot:13310452-Alexandrium_andersonii.AAC.1
MPRDAVCYVADIAISHGFYTVDATGTIGGGNHYVYFVEQNTGAAVLRRAALPEGSYAAEELAAAMAAQ